MSQSLIHIVTLFEITHLICINYDMFTIMYHVVFIYINIMSAYYIYINQTYNDISKKYSYLKNSGICLKKISDSRLASQQHVNNGYWAIIR